MKIIIEEVSEEKYGVPYMARSVESKDKKQYTRLLENPKHFEKFFIFDVEFYHKEKLSEIIFNPVPWAKKRNEFIKRGSEFL